MQVRSLSPAVDRWFWPIVLTFGLVLSFQDFLHDAGRYGFSIIIIVLMFNYQTLRTEWRSGVPKWILIPWFIIVLSSLAHAQAHRELEDFAGLALMTMLLGVYLYARHHRQEMRYCLAWLAIAGSIALLVHRMLDQQTIYPGLLGVFHTAAFAILIGIVLAPDRLKIPTLLLGIPAIIVSGSEEGIVILLGLTIYWLFVSKSLKKLLIVTGLMSLAIVPLLMTDVTANVYPRLREDRFTSGLNTMSHRRWEAYVDLVDHPTVALIGRGWQWVSVGSADEEDFIPRWATIHNAPLRAMTQFGLLAGVAWLALMLSGLRKSKSKYVFLIILGFALFDHLPWTYGLAWPFVVLGVEEVVY